MTDSEFTRIIEAQCQWVNEKFGIDRAVNLGWGAGEDGVASKVYGADGGILASYLNTRGKVMHDFMPWIKRNSGTSD